MDKCCDTINPYFRQSISINYSVIVNRGVLSPLFYEEAPIFHILFFKNVVQPPSPHIQPPPSLLFLWLNG